MTKTKFHIYLVLPSVFLALSFKSKSQISTLQTLNGQTVVINPITTAVPFLLIGPDSKQGAMGDVGAATDPDANSIHWNGSKMIFSDKKFTFGLSATPWLRTLVPDIYLYYLGGFAKVKKNTAVGGSLRYFSLGNIDLTNINGVQTGSIRPNEFALDAAISQRLSDNFSMGVAMRFINSGISRAFTSNANSASTAAVDISGYYKSNEFKLSDKKAIATGGFALTNLGAKIKYSNDPNFIPMNMRLGGGLKTKFDEYNTFGFYLDFNKLLVPTSPLYKTKLDANGNPTNEIEIDPATNEKVILKGKNPNVPVAQGIFQSFGDAPGGFNEELQEVNICAGADYTYNNVFSLRAGYFYEPKTKGSRQYVSFGAGFKYNVIRLDLSYLIPTLINNPLARTLRFSLTFDFDPAKKEQTPNPATQP
jgi:hypothetical protein